MIEHSIDKNRMEKVKKDARKKAMEDFKIIYRIF